MGTAAGGAGGDWDDAWSRGRVVLGRGQNRTGVRGEVSSWKNAQNAR
jgi:hypothetical protein